MDYKKYSLENLENWMHDAMSVDDATPQEVYDVIIGVVKENYYTYKEQASKAYELLSLMNGNGEELYNAVKKEKEYYEGSMNKEELSQYKEILSCDKDDTSSECVKHWDEFWEGNYQSEKSNSHSESWYEYDRNDPNRINPFKQDKVVKWQLPVQVDGLTGECYINLPDDLLRAANLKEGDTVEWIDRGDGSFEMRKVTKLLAMDEC